MRILPIRACCGSEAMRDALDYKQKNAVRFGIDIVSMSCTFPLGVGPAASGRDFNWTAELAGVAGLALSAGLVPAGDALALRAWLLDPAHHATDGSLTGFVEASRFLNACLAVEGVCP